MAAAAATAMAMVWFMSFYVKAGVWDGL